LARIVDYSSEIQPTGAPINMRWVGILIGFYLAN
jgi:hypothetical protein